MTSLLPISHFNVQRGNTLEVLKNSDLIGAILSFLQRNEMVLFRQSVRTPHTCLVAALRAQAQPVAKIEDLQRIEKVAKSSLKPLDQTINLSFYYSFVHFPEKDLLRYLDSCHNLTTLDLSQWEDFNERLLPRIAELSSLRYLVLPNQLTNQGIRLLAKHFPRLQTLSIQPKGNEFSSKISEAGFEPLCELTELERLGVNGVNITNDILKKISDACTKLTSLRLKQTSVNDEGMLNLPEGLRELSLKHTDTSDWGLYNIQMRCSQLRTLNLHSQFKITEMGISSFSTDLERLSLYNVQIGKDPLIYIAESCPRLKILHVSGRQLTQEGLLNIGSLSELEELQIGDLPETLDPRIDQDLSIFPEPGTQSIFPKLIRLDFSQVSLSDQGVSKLTNASNLQFLRLGSNYRGLKSLESLAVLHQLKYLEVFALPSKLQRMAKKLIELRDKGQPELEIARINGVSRRRNIFWNAWSS